MIDGIALGGVLVAGLIWIVLGGLPYTPQRMSDSFQALEDVTPAAQATVELCASIPCVEAWQTGVGNFLRFDSDAVAESWHIVIGGDSYRNGSVVLDMNGLTLTPSERKLAAELLFPGREFG